MLPLYHVVNPIHDRLTLNKPLSACEDFEVSTTSVTGAILMSFKFIDIIFNLFSHKVM